MEGQRQGLGNMMQLDNSTARSNSKHSTENNVGEEGDLNQGEMNESSGPEASDDDFQDNMVIDEGANGSEFPYIPPDTEYKSDRLRRAASKNVKYQMMDDDEFDNLLEEESKAAAAQSKKKKSKKPVRIVSSTTGVDVVSGAQGPGIVPYSISDFFPDKDVEKILCHRPLKIEPDSPYFNVRAVAVELWEAAHGRKKKKTPGEAKLELPEALDMEYLVKWKNYAYLHTEWVAGALLLNGQYEGGKVMRYHAKRPLLWTEECDGEIFNPTFTEVDRICSSRVSDDGTNEFLVKWQNLGYEDVTWERQEDINDDGKITAYWERQVPPPASSLRPFIRPPPSDWKPLETSPEYKDGHTLRTYQVEGLNWLSFCWHNKTNSILADEMGLGKTVQSVSIICYLYEKYNIRGAFLVVAPLSTIPHWKREFEAWTNLNVVIYHGTAEARQLIIDTEFYYPNMPRNVHKFNVIITTYDMVMKDVSVFSNIHWKYMVVDEAHRLKNKDGRLYSVMKDFSADYILLLTGTPLQNNTQELWALLHFMEPKTFNSLSEFMLEFGDLKQADQVEKLHAILRPRLLRRMKEDVEKSIAPKEETIIEVDLTEIQKKWYKAIYEHNFSVLSAGAKSTNVPSLLNVMMQLRKCCNHPFLLQGVEDSVLASVPNRNDPYQVLNLMIRACGKLVLVDKLLKKLHEQGHKVLIFSQMVRMLDILEDYMHGKGYKYERLDGRIRGNDRQAAIDRFSKPGSDRFCFLLCTRAGGLGINLTAADTVIIYDSDWNPQNDVQAQARCHRIGQTQMVKIYRLITKGTYESAMFEKASRKLGLDEAVLSKIGGSTAGEGKSAGWKPNAQDRQQINMLLKQGAYGAFREGEETNYDEDDIEMILSRKSKTIVHEANRTSTFSKATFTTAESSNVAINDPDFWAKIMPDSLDKANPLIMSEPRTRKSVNRYLPELELDEEDEDDEAYIAAGGTKGGWKKAERNRLKSVLCDIGFGRWSTIRREARLERHTPGEIKAYATAMVEKIAPILLMDPEQLIANVQIEETHSILEEEEGDLSPPKEDYGVDPILNHEWFADYLARNSRKMYNSMERIAQIHSIVIPCKDHIESIPLPEKLQQPPVPWWGDEEDRNLLYAVYVHGTGHFDRFRTDSSFNFTTNMPDEVPVVQKKEEEKDAAPTTEETLPEDEAAKEAKKEETEGFSEAKPENGEQPAPLKVEEKAEHVPDSKPSEVKNEELQDSKEEEALSSEQLKDEPLAVATVGAPELAEDKRAFMKPELLDDDRYVVPAPCWPSDSEFMKRIRSILRGHEIRRNKTEREQKKKDKEQEKQKKLEEKEKGKLLKANERQKRKLQMMQQWNKTERLALSRAFIYFGTPENEDGSIDWESLKDYARVLRKTTEAVKQYGESLLQRINDALTSGVSTEGEGSKYLVDENSGRQCRRIVQRIAWFKELRTLAKHEQLDEGIQKAVRSASLPIWWIPGVHDKALILGLAKYGLSRIDDMCRDPELPFKTIAELIMKRRAERAGLPFPPTTPTTPSAAASISTSQQQSADQDMEDANGEEDQEMAIEEEEEEEPEEEDGEDDENKQKTPKSDSKNDPLAQCDYSDALKFPREPVLIKRVEYICRLVSRPNSQTNPRRVTVTLISKDGLSQKRQTTLDFGGNAGGANPFPSALTSRRRRRSGSAIESNFDVERDEDGNPKMPLQLKNLTIHSLGTIVVDREAFHQKKYIWPVGFTSSKLYRSFKDSEMKVTYVSEILDGGDAPLFRVTAEDAPDEPAEGSSATAAWNIVLTRVNDALAEHQRRNVISVSGPEMYGISNPLIRRLIFELPGADRLENLQLDLGATPEPKQVKTPEVAPVRSRRPNRKYIGDDEDYEIAELVAAGAQGSEEAEEEEDEEEKGRIKRSRVSTPASAEPVFFIEENGTQVQVQQDRIQQIAEGPSKQPLVFTKRSNQLTLAESVARATI